MTKQEKLIIYYTERLEKIKAFYAGDCRKEDYIKFAEKELEEVKTGEPGNNSKRASARRGEVADAT